MSDYALLLVISIIPKECKLIKNPVILFSYIQHNKNLDNAVLIIKINSQDNDIAERIYQNIWNMIGLFEVQEMELDETDP